MGISIVALWKAPNDVEGFEQHYFATHIPIAREIPGVELVTGKVTSGPYYRVAQMRFGRAEELAEAFGSEAAQKLMADTAHIEEAFGASADVLTVEDDAQG